VTGQYFSWREILRNEMQFLSFPEVEKTRAVADPLNDIAAVFRSDDPALGNVFKVSLGEQRAIGELMTVSTDDQEKCVGYAGFLVSREAGAFGKWFARLETDIEHLAQGKVPDLGRLRMLQNELINLIDTLDPKHVHYPADELVKA
jgi:hypothetical protein